MLATLNLVIILPYTCVSNHCYTPEMNTILYVNLYVDSPQFFLKNYVLLKRESGLLDTNMHCGRSTFFFFFSWKNRFF